jgi:hypothetical protein
MTYVGIGEAWDVDPPWTITKVMRLEFGLLLGTASLPCTAS